METMTGSELAVLSSAGVAALVVVGSVCVFSVGASAEIILLVLSSLVLSELAGGKLLLSTSVSGFVGLDDLDVW
jgi:hypothetical protein